MSETIASQVLDRARTTGKVADEDVTALRREIYDSGAVDQDELKNLFEIERARSAHNPLWSALFREAVVDLALFRTPPSGYLSDDNAQWLIAQIGDRKDARTDTELEALAALVERAQQVPLDFSAYVLRQIKNAVVYADGPDAAGRTLTPGAIAGPEIKLIQRVLWGAGCGGHLAISRDEAEALFEIADSTTGAKNDPAWPDLFARAVGNYLLGATARPVPTREQALQFSSARDDRDVVDVLTGVLNGVARLLRKGGLAHIRETIGAGGLGEQVEARIAADEAARAAARAEAERLIGEKAGWLVDRIRRNGLVSGPERELLGFVKREAKSLSPELEALILATAEAADSAPPAPAKTFGRRNPDAKSA